MPGRISLPMEAVRLTNDEALVCKLSASQVGLLPDEFVEAFVNHGHHHHHRRHLKPPIINRGTFLRSVSIDSVVIKFVEENSKFGCQIVSLGAGYDTRYFRLKSGHELSSLRFEYFEVDFESVMEEKQKIISERENLERLSANLHLISADLNTLEFKASSNPPQSPTAVLGPAFDPLLPTLILAECCLMYLTAEAGDFLISWAGSLAASSTFCCFDPVLGKDLESDRFGQIMLDNLSDRGLDSRSILKYPSRGDIENRFGIHFSSIKSFSMLELEQEAESLWLVDRDHRKTLSVKAALDEYEEWNLLAQHYLLTIAQTQSKSKN